MPVNAFVLLRTEGVTAVIDLTDGRLPSIPYWGADLGELSDVEVAAIARSSRVPDGRQHRRRSGPARPAPRALDRLGGPARAQRLTRRAGTGHRSSPPPPCGSTATPVDRLERPGAGRRPRPPGRGRRGRRGRRPGLHGHPRAAGRRTAPGPGGRDQPGADAYQLDDLRARLPGAAGGPRDPGPRRSLGQGADRRSAARSASASTCARAARAVPGPTPRPCCTSATPGSPSPRARSGPCTPAGAATTRTTPSGCPPASR